MIEEAVGILYIITVALKGPVVLGILLALGWVLFETGAFLHEAFERLRTSKDWRELQADFARRETEEADTLLERLKNAAVPDLIRRLVVDEARAFSAGPAEKLERLLEEVEFAAARRLLRQRLGLRIGPLIGLMGTLIPMGPALKNIAMGNLAVMSNDMIIAFGTTVAGLFVGALCYVMLSIRQIWYARDIADLERLARMERECT